MRNKILAVGILIILAVVDYLATTNLGGPAVASHRSEFMSDWFKGTTADWIGLIAFNALWLIVAVCAAFNITLSYEEKGSYGKSILYAFAGSAICLAMIYL